MDHKMATPLLIALSASRPSCFVVEQCDYRNDRAQVRMANGFRLGPNLAL